MLEQAVQPKEAVYTRHEDDPFEPDEIAFAPAFLDEITRTAYNVITDKLKDVVIDPKITAVLDDVIIIHQIQAQNAAGRMNAAANKSLVDYIQELSHDLVDLAGWDAWQDHS